MTEEKQEKVKKPKKKINSNARLSKLQGKEIVVVFTDGKALKGTLIGVATYELFVRQANGLELNIFKHAIKYLHLASTANES